MTDIDALIERLKERATNTSNPQATSPTLCRDAAAALVRMRDDAKQLETENSKFFEWAMAAKMRAQAAEAEVARLREALTEIKEGYVPDAPATFAHDELAWAYKWVGTLRRKAEDALAQRSE